MALVLWTLRLGLGLGLGLGFGSPPPWQPVGRPQGSFDIEMFVCSTVTATLQESIKNPQGTNSKPPRINSNLLGNTATLQELTAALQMHPTINNNYPKTRGCPSKYLKPPKSYEQIARNIYMVCESSAPPPPVWAPPVLPEPPQTRILCVCSWSLAPASSAASRMHSRTGGAHTRRCTHKAVHTKGGV